MKEKHTQWLDHQNNQVSRMFWLFVKLIKFNKGRRFSTLIDRLSKVVKVMC